MPAPTLTLTVQDTEGTIVLTTPSAPAYPARSVMVCGYPPPAWLVTCIQAIAHVSARGRYRFDLYLVPSITYYYWKFFDTVVAPYAPNYSQMSFTVDIDDTLQTTVPVGKYLASFENTWPTHKWSIPYSYNYTYLGTTYPLNIIEAGGSGGTILPADGGLHFPGTTATLLVAPPSGKTVASVLFNGAAVHVGDTLTFPASDSTLIITYSGNPVTPPNPNPGPGPWDAPPPPPPVWPWPNAGPNPWPTRPSDDHPTLLMPAVSGFKDMDGNPLANGMVYAYAEGTTERKALWSDFAQTFPVPQPFALDSRGCALVYGFGNYKFVVCNSEGAVIQTFDHHRLGFRPMETV